MKLRDRVFGFGSAIVLALSIVVAPAAVPAAATVQSCTLYANTPYRSTNWIEATAMSTPASPQFQHPESPVPAP